MNTEPETKPQDAANDPGMTDAELDAFFALSVEEKDSQPASTWRAVLEALKARIAREQAEFDARMALVHQPYVEPEFVAKQAAAEAKAEKPKTYADYLPDGVTDGPLASLEEVADFKAMTDDERRALPKEQADAAVRRISKDIFEAVMAERERNAREREAEKAKPVKVTVPPAAFADYFRRHP